MLRWLAIGHPRRHCAHTSTPCHRSCQWCHSISTAEGRGRDSQLLPSSQ